MDSIPSQPIKDKGKVFRDPVHRLIRIEKEDQFILDLINTPEMQRLRRVRQLGVSSLTYHGAEHSRFSHSLGVFNFAQRIVAALERRYGTEHEVSTHLKNNARALKAASLLHDLGHGPFSHMIERASGKSFDHEQMTVWLITSPKTEVNQVLLRHGIEPRDVSGIIDKTFEHQLLVDIVSSQLDADRMDYLLRDSLMTGVEYGIYDAEWLLNAMCVGRDPTAKPEAPLTSAWRLCLDRDRGLFAAEQLILARHHMMHQVYMHRVTRGYEVMLLSVFTLVAKAVEQGELMADVPGPVRAYFQHGMNMDHADWLDFDETAMTSALQAWGRSRGPVANMTRAFLQRRRLYTAFPIDKLSAPQVMDLQKGLAEQKLEEFVDWGVDNGEHLPYKGAYARAAKEKDSEEGSTLSILLADGNPASNGRPIESESPLFKLLDNDHQSVTRLYLARQRVECAGPLLRNLGLLHGGEP